MGLIKQAIKKIRYPKFIVLILTFILAYFILYHKNFSALRDLLSSSGYLGAFLSGIFYDSGFTAGMSTATFILLSKTLNIILAGLLGGLGALITDLLIFKFVRWSFEDEIKKLSKEKLLLKFDSIIPNQLKKVFVPLIAMFFIGSPLPDEIGITLLAATTNVKIKTIAVLSFTLNTAGILTILMLGKAI